MDDAIGWVVGIVIVGVIFGMYKGITHQEDPCRAKTVEYRQELIESHERCMTEANCIYEDWDIRRYDKRLAQRASCEVNRNED